MTDEFLDMAAQVKADLGDDFLEVRATADSWLIGLVVEASDMKEAAALAESRASEIARGSGLPAWEVTELRCEGPATVTLVDDQTLTSQSVLQSTRARVSFHRFENPPEEGLSR